MSCFLIITLVRIPGVARPASVCRWHGEILIKKLRGGIFSADILTIHHLFLGWALFVVLTAMDAMVASVQSYMVANLLKCILFSLWSWLPSTLYLCYTCSDCQSRWAVLNTRCSEAEKNMTVDTEESLMCLPFSLRRYSLRLFHSLVKCLRSINRRFFECLGSSCHTESSRTPVSAWFVFGADYFSLLLQYLVSRSWTRSCSKY